LGKQSAERVEILQGVRNSDLLLRGNTAKLRVAPGNGLVTPFHAHTKVP
jgi:hypothetical protein